MASPVCMKELAARLVDSFIGVSAKIIPLRLEKIGRKTVAAIGIVEGERCAEGRNGNPFLRCDRDDLAPGPLSCLDGCPEERGKKQVRKLWLLIKCFFDFPQ